MKPQLTTTSTLHNSVLQIGILTIALLSLPLIAMQFSSDVNWGILDFVVAGIGIFTTGMLFKLILIKAHSQYRYILVMALLAGFFLIWAELAVGLFGSPFAGS